MHVSWMQGERPVWRLGCGPEVERGAGAGGHAHGSTMGAGDHRDGSVRGARVRLSGGQARIVMLVRGADESDAAHRGLSVVDVAVRQVPRLRLGALLWRSVTPADLVASAASVSGSSS